MRIKYTLPGLDPGRTPSLGPSESANASFKAKLQRLRQTDTPSWKEVLRLDQSHSDAGTIGPPPKPDTLEIGDAAAERVRWRNLVVRKAGGADSRVSQMLELLRDFQSMEDGLIARHLAETRG